MTTAALVFMLVSVCGVVALVVWCYYRVLTTPRPPAAGADHEDPGTR
ncbi:MAG TPA: hypothetical protein VMO24_00085 [Woeseiaceae bacterium]|jgi:hypothetical protein|nr:hypothetical protein [Woeseiaceae bacterium]